ncbi:MAG: EAL domain-containing protein [Acidobacteria bacterium]|nr:MAG: EAL domain-containing protein [Acidobacteriota bacterium]
MIHELSVLMLQSEIGEKLLSLFCLICLVLITVKSLFTYPLVDYILFALLFLLFSSLALVFISLFRKNSNLKEERDARLKLQENLDELKKKLSAIESENNKLISEKSNLIAEKARLEAKFSEFQSEIHRLESEKNELSNEIESLQKLNEEILIESDKFRNASLHDPLTNLCNRAFLVEKLDFLLQLCRNNPRAKFYVLFMDLKDFKKINDYYGHTVGDKVLRLVARRIMRVVSLEDTVVRIGGDEFGVIISDILSVEKVREIALKIHESLTQYPFRIRQGHKIQTKLHIGFAAYSPDHHTPEDILRDADIAMHEARETGAPVVFFDSDLRERFLREAQIERGLNVALEENQFLLFYQPIVSLKSKEIVGFEVLLRWRHPSGFISPAEFIPIAEKTGLIIPMTNWILAESCSQLVRWQEKGLVKKNVTVSVNLSAMHFALETLPDEVAEILNKTGLNPSNLRLEITETSAMESPESSASVLNRLKQTGVLLAIDDFGTGYSSLSQLYHLPFDNIKIDRAFIVTDAEDTERFQILRAIIGLGKSLKMSLTAEGIEQDLQFLTLLSLGCDYGQGYLIAKPMPKEEVEAFMLRSGGILEFLPSAETVSLPTTIL